MLKSVALDLVALGPLLVGKALVGAGLRRRPEGWRRTVGVVLRGEATKFAFGVFGLKSPADPVAALAAFLERQPAVRFKLVHRKHLVERVPAEPVVDVRTEPTPADRFRSPDFTGSRDFGGPFRFVLRPAGGDTLDVWLCCHHTAADGAPVQEMLAELAAAWGTTDVRFPAAGTTSPVRLASAPGEREVYESTSFVDFGPLLAARKEVAARHGVEVSVVALLAWALAGRPEFAGVKFATTADVPAGGGYERDVGLVPVRPADFAGDLSRYAAAYRAALADVRDRRGPVRDAMCGAAHLPPALFRAMLNANPGRTADTFGAVGISFVKGAQVFVAPFADVGYPGGFLAVGDVRLPSADGGFVGAVSVKGTRAQAEGHPAVIRAAVAGCRESLPGRTC